MTWQLAAFAILGVGLAAGFAWYEHARPDARIVALVATLAAFAALGRIAFAALPNVKPTSDIVLVAGYALGPGPGFVVGALAGLTSNFFFGQGPWTPWQMAAWGATGILGAGLAPLTRRRIGRWPLALVCAVAGFAFTAVQDVGDWVTYSDHSVGQLGAYVGQGLGFDGIYAGSCLVFALAFGPALLRSIVRFATRLQVRWEPLAPAAIALILLGGLAGSRAAQAANTGWVRSVSYLRAAQNTNGGLGAAPGQPSSELYSGWAALGLAAEGIDPRTVVRDGHSLTGYIEAGAGSGTDPGSLERTILALRAAGLPVRGELARLVRDFGADGSISDQSNWTAFGVMALRAAGVSPTQRTIGWLMRQQDADGGFNYATAGGTSDVDDSGAVLEAIGSIHNRVTAGAARFIERQQNRDGGFPSQAGETPNAQSTAWAVQGLIAAGAGRSTSVTRALRYLDTLIASNGEIRYSAGVTQSPVWVTGEALMALARKPLPLAPVNTPASPRANGFALRAVRTRVRHSARRPRARGLAGGATGTEAQELSADLGIAEALALAPVGLG